MGRRGWRRDLRHFLGNLPLLVGVLGITAIVLLALFGSRLAPYDPNAWQLVEFRPGGGIAVPPIPPGRFHWLGTDSIGRDLLSRLLWGARLTLAATLITVCARLALALLVGVTAGWRRGWFDTIALAAINAITGFPQLMLALLLVVLLHERGLPGFIVALSAVGWGEVAQFLRGETIRLRRGDALEAARALGATTPHLVRQHLLRNLAPQLTGLVAIEAGAVLLLLAELGFIGFFISGGTFLVDGAGQPLLPVRDRAAEWGQMLAGARYYTFVQQWIAIVPAVVVGSAVLIFNLAGEGIRAAIDPFNPRHLSPRALALLGRGALALTLVALLGLGLLTLRSTEISYDEGLRRARDAAARVAPGSELVAAVVRFRSDTHALAQPEKLNYYFKAPGSRDVLYVGFHNADANALEVRQFYDDDGLPTETLQPLAPVGIGWWQALDAAERRGGLAYRNATRNYLVQVVLEQREGWSAPAYHVAYTRLPGNTPDLDLPVDAQSGADEIAFPIYQQDAAAQARRALGGPVTLVGVSTSRWGPALAAMPADNAAALPPPVYRAFTFASASGAVSIVYDARTAFRATINPDPAPELTITGRVNPALRGPWPELPLPQPPAALPGDVDASAVLGLAEEAGGRAIHEEWTRSGGRSWTVAVLAYGSTGGTTVEVAYFREDQDQLVRFRVDLAARRAERLP